ncbi:hypothetical protein Tco_1207940, partial [Tanacetum coccineum]
MAGSDDENPPPPPPQTPTQQAPYTVLTIKLPILKKCKERERKARTTLLMALPEDHLAKFHKMTDAKEIWDAIKSRFGVDWTGHAKDEQENFALMAYSNSGSDTERKQLGDATIEIQAFTQALEKLSANDKDGFGHYGAKESKVSETITSVSKVET